MANLLPKQFFQRCIFDGQRRVLSRTSTSAALSPALHRRHLSTTQSTVHPSDSPLLAGMPKKVKIVEVGPRDGLQNEKDTVKTCQSHPSHRHNSTSFLFPLLFHRRIFDSHHPSSQNHPWLSDFGILVFIFSLFFFLFRRVVPLDSDQTSDD